MRLVGDTSLLLSNQNQPTASNVNPVPSTGLLANQNTAISTANTAGGGSTNPNGRNKTQPPAQSKTLSARQWAMLYEDLVQFLNAVLSPLVYVGEGQGFASLLETRVRVGMEPPEMEEMKPILMPIVPNSAGGMANTLAPNPNSIGTLTNPNSATHMSIAPGGTYQTLSDTGGSGDGVNGHGSGTGNATQTPGSGTNTPVGPTHSDSTGDKSHTETFTRDMGQGQQSTLKHATTAPMGHAAQRTAGHASTGHASTGARVNVPVRLALSSQSDTHGPSALAANAAADLTTSRNTTPDATGNGRGTANNAEVHGDTCLKDIPSPTSGNKDRKTGTDGPNGEACDMKPVGHKPRKVGQSLVMDLADDESDPAEDAEKGVNADPPVSTTIGVDATARLHMALDHTPESTAEVLDRANRNSGTNAPGAASSHSDSASTAQAPSTSSGSGGPAAGNAGASIGTGNGTGSTGATAPAGVPGTPGAGSGGGGGLGVGTGTGMGTNYPGIGLGNPGSASTTPNSTSQVPKGRCSLREVVFVTCKAGPASFNLTNTDAYNFATTFEIDRPMAKDQSGHATG
ncbi:hypothetical protein SARC_13932 [Sphaeroforma arctica JP610]|uniref:Uncharacterized protein n=1 Tax=Sphaeroforma arctica JP610 TaxID=667725 RepID=A0A0L0F9W9_9EUKA|nr:hypothetical protein SARC_13932 [Sphaeroforma arctica JP610]KNC73510.1 hypothetical protein SARC_13932 [Sphaeroforma arctica JP610]|eukprot:XP_014147412.1 hypothetical protein SARC_13932 [Sphaeroforma arctica JP610]